MDPLCDDMNPVIPPRPDIPFMGGSKPSTPTPPLPERGQSLDGSSYNSNRRREPPPVPPHLDPDWEAREQMRMRELEEARQRAAQMEKTMRWWSDCTANWREKWSKVRNERNKAREECRHLRQKLETAVKECSTLKRAKQDIAKELDSLKKQMDSCAAGTSEKDKTSCASSSDSRKSSGIVERENTPETFSEKETDASNTAISHTDQINFMDKLLSKKEKDTGAGSEHGDHADTNSSSSDRPDLSKVKTVDQTPTPEGSLTEEKLSMLQMRLEEAQKTIQAERDEKTQLVKSMEKLQSEVTAHKDKYDELKCTHTQVSQELQHLTEEHQRVLGRMESELEDESHSRITMDKRLADLRRELERLQEENATEWGKRERLETEKLALERDNKKMKSQVADLQESLERKSKQASSMLDGDLRALQADLAERSKELGDLKHTHSKLKKLLQEKTTELEHAQRRAEQYELEVKKLRGRIEELKRDLTNAEDEADQQGNQVRRLQRTNDELQEQVENLQVQLEHLQARLRRTAPQPLVHSRSSSMKSFELNDESTDALSDEDESLPAS